jgi:ATP-binding cassette subfamily F protein 3
VQRATRLAQQQSMYESQQQRVAHLQSYIDRFKAKATKAKQAQSRIKMLERMELIAPAHVDNPFHFSFREPESLPNPLLKMEKVSAGYGERIILDSIKLNLVPGSRIGLLGRNGAGKSTLIKLLAGELTRSAAKSAWRKASSSATSPSISWSFCAPMNRRFSTWRVWRRRSWSRSCATISAALASRAIRSRRHRALLRRRKGPSGAGADRLAAPEPAAAR